MSAASTIVEGVVKPDGTLEVSEKLDLPPRGVQITVQSVTERSTSTHGSGARRRRSTPRGLRLRKQPASFVVPTERQKLAAGRVILIRRVRPAGTVSVPSQSYRVGKRHRGLYLRLVIDTGRGTLTAYSNGRVLRRWPDKLRNE